MQCGHIEDVVVDKGYQGRRLGYRRASRNLAEALLELGCKYER